MAAAQREIWTGTQLRRLLTERAGLQLSSVSALFTKEPVPAQAVHPGGAVHRAGVECTPNDLIEVDTTPVPWSAPPPTARGRPAGQDRLDARLIDAAPVTARPDAGWDGCHAAGLRGYQAGEELVVDLTDDQLVALGRVRGESTSQLHHCPHVVRSGMSDLSGDVARSASSFYLPKPCEAPVRGLRPSAHYPGVRR